MLAPFAALPGKENGINVEGLAARGGKLFVGFRGLKDFFPAYLADNLARYTKSDGVESEHVTLTHQVLEGEVSSLHAAYLARREALRAACSHIVEAFRSSHFRSNVGVATTLALTGLVGAKALVAVHSRKS